MVSTSRALLIIRVDAKRLRLLLSITSSPSPIPPSPPSWINFQAQFPSGISLRLPAQCLSLQTTISLLCFRNNFLQTLPQIRSTSASLVSQTMVSTPRLLTPFLSSCLSLLRPQAKQVAVIVPPAPALISPPLAELLPSMLPNRSSEKLARTTTTMRTWMILSPLIRILITVCGTIYLP